MKNLLASLLLGTMVAALSACNGELSKPVKTFALKLEGMDVRRASNHEPVEIHISGIESGVLRLGQ